MRRPPPDAARVELEVPFHDVDALQIVWHGHYYKYLEIARVALFRARGLDVGYLLGTGYTLLVAESKCRHISPLRYGDRVAVSAWCTEVSHRIRVRYEVWNLTEDVRAARAETSLVTVDGEGALQVSTPEELRRVLVS